jgi:transposase
MTEAYDGRQVVGMDLHRRRSVLVRMTEDGRKLETVRIANSSAALRREIAKAGKHPRVVLEATYGWYWAADVLEAAGAEVHLAYPLGVRAYGCRRVKNDQRDAADLADLLRMGRLPEAWIAPPEIRELRELTRYRHRLVQARTSVKDQVHAVLAKLGVPVTHSDLFGVHGQAWLDELKLPQPYAGKIASLRQLAGGFTAEIGLLEQVLGDLLAGHEGYAAIQQLPGIGPVLAAVIVAETGDIRRFRHPGQLGCWAGLTPRHRESDAKVTRGHISKMVCAGGMVPLRRPEVCDGGGWRIGFAQGSADVRLCRYRDGRELAWPDLACGPGEPARVAAPVPRRAGRGVRGRGVHRVALRGGGTAAGRDHCSPGRARRDGRPAGPQAPRQDGLG